MIEFFFIKSQLYDVESVRVRYNCLYRGISMKILKHEKYFSFMMSINLVKPINSDGLVCHIFLVVLYEKYFIYMCI